ncbi:MAG: hypothetical protein JW741_17765, partial [Sedimentisphaerales bacterium]|nr:hypothetical protein [Sedimentisphaerales bacterium]
MTARSHSRLVVRKQHSLETYKRNDGMRGLMRTALIVAVVLAGCDVEPFWRRGRQSEPAPKAPSSAAGTPRRMTPVPEPTPATGDRLEGVAIRLDGQTRLTLRGAVSRGRDTPISYALFAPSAATQAAGQEGTTTQPEGVRERYLLKPAEGADAPIECQISYASAGEATITLSTPGVLPDIQLLGVTPSLTLPVRYSQPDETDVMQSALGRVADERINAFLDAAAGDVFAIDGEVEYELARDGTVLRIVPPEPRRGNQVVAKLALHAGCIEKGPLAVDPLVIGTSASGAPAGWSACRGGSELTDEDLLRVAR